MSTIEEIKARLDIVEIVSENVQLKRSGKNLSGFCPFHDNTRTPAFVVWPETNTWRCFGQCDEGGDIFKYVMKREGWDFPEALKFLAERAGVELRPLTPQETIQKEENQQLRDLLESTVTFYRHQLRHHPEGRTALEYLHKRGLTDETIDTFELGYAPPGWETSHPQLLEKGYTVKDLIEAGVASERDSGGLYDRFRNRVMFPIRDGRGRMAGFGARALSDEDMPKYLNSPQTVLFDKSSLLYGFDKARKSIRAQDQVVIVEGYLDVIAPHQEGYTNLVSPMGTALNEVQLNQLKRLTRRIVLALDADAAGEKATLRGLQVARETLGRENEMVFDARGLLRSEARLKADIRVTTLPDGLDPDEVVIEDPQKLQMLIDQAKPIVIHVMETLAAGQNLDDPKIKIEISEQVIPLIQDLPSAIERDTYIQQLARLLRVDERTLLADQQGSQGRRSRKPIRRKPQVESDPAAEHTPPASNDLSELLLKLEQHCLSIILREPEFIYKINRALKQGNLPAVTENDFTHTGHQEIFKVSLNAIDQDNIEPANYALENVPFSLLEQTDQILGHSKDFKLKQDQVIEDLLRSILRLREYHLRDNNNQLRFLLTDAEEIAPDRIPEYHQVIQQNSLVLFNIQKALAKPNIKNNGS
ncbi:MAG: DNA primase [Chloroflexota bacterium]